MAEKRMILIGRSATPESRGPAEEQCGVNMPILEEIDQCVLVIQTEQLWIDGIKLFPHQMMKRHARVLSGTLDQPIQHQTLVDLIAQIVIAHGQTCAFGSGVGRVEGQSGLNGSNSRCGWGGGTVCGKGAGSACGLSGGASGSV